MKNTIITIIAFGCFLAVALMGVGAMFAERELVALGGIGFILLIATAIGVIVTIPDEQIHESVKGL